MPWKTVDKMSLRNEFITLAQQAACSFSELCHRYHISRKTGYKWRHRYLLSGIDGLKDRSRRPNRIIRKTLPDTEGLVVDLRRRHPGWGARKLRRRLEALGHSSLPACSTITAILRRYGLIVPDENHPHRDWQRFEYPAPNCLWQMDFKGQVPTLTGLAHPLTVLDDCSRFSLGISILPHQKGTTVQTSLTSIFQRYGIPDAILVDNGSPWGSDAEHPHTPLTVWLMLLEIDVWHSRPYHPQTLGKDERFHRTLKHELLSRKQWRDLDHLQRSSDTWRQQYNFERPHEALDMNTPASRYRSSIRSFPEKLPPLEYPAGLHVRKVQQGGKICFRGKTFTISKAFCGYPVAMSPTSEDGVFNVLFRHHQIGLIDMRNCQ